MKGLTIVGALLLILGVLSFIVPVPHQEKHALIALGDSSKSTRREAVQALSQRLGFDPSAVLQVLEARENKVDRGKVNVADLAGRYLAAVERVTAAVDTALDEKTPGRA